MITTEMYEIEIPIITEKNLAAEGYDSFARGYHAKYGHLDMTLLLGAIMRNMDIWI